MAKKKRSLERGGCEGNLKPDLTRLLSAIFAGEHPKAERCLVSQDMFCALCCMHLSQSGLSKPLRTGARDLRIQSRPVRIPSPAMVSLPDGIGFQC